MKQKGPVALTFPRRLNWSITTAQHMNAAIFSKLVPDEFYDASFAVLRNPIERMKSEYRYRANRMETTLPFNEWAELMLHTVQRDPYAFDNHIRPQVDFLQPSMLLFKFELGPGDVFDWIDAVTETDAGNRDIHKNVSRPMDIDISNDVVGQIEEYYSADFALLNAFERAATQGIRLRKLTVAGS